MFNWALASMAFVSDPFTAVSGMGCFHFKLISLTAVSEQKLNFFLYKRLTGMTALREHVHRLWLRYRLVCLFFYTYSFGALT